MNRDKQTFPPVGGSAITAEKTEQNFLFNFQWAFIFTRYHLKFFRRNRKREQSENKYISHTQKCMKHTICKCNNIIIYPTKIWQYNMWITH
jgi:hypothetical protein